jgi:hypothetical protein
MPLYKSPFDIAMSLENLHPIMNFLSGNKNQNQNPESQKEGGGGLVGKVNESLGGGQGGEQKEGTLVATTTFGTLLIRLLDPLDKGNSPSTVS